MSKAIKIKKGADIKLIGKADKTTSAATQSKVFALKPDDFFGTTPKLSVKEGAEVKAGSPLFYDKTRTRVKFTSPV
ncbi:MAG: Na+-transporting NADH:ubiquinone oxidoreductase subunit A, partial [Flammeovirgaceae bacterium]